MKKTEKTVKKPKRTIRITAALTKSIALILALSVLVPLIGYYMLPDWVYYLTAATRLYFAGITITTEYNGDNLNETIHTVEMNYDSTVEIVDKNNVLIYSTDAAEDNPDIDVKKHIPIDAESTIDRYPVTEGRIKDTGWGFLIRQYSKDLINVTFLDFYTHTDDGDRVEICMQVSQATTLSKIEILVTFMALMMFIVIALIIIIQYMKKFAKPIHTMVDITGKMSRLDFSEKCPPVKYEEFAKLSASINDMSQSLDDALTELKEKNDKLQQDIENERTIDELRQTFISGISHELKTPIAIIQGYAEGAKAFYNAGNTELADKYCDTIAEEANRMNNMIMKLLEITRYDSGAYEPVRDDFNLHDEVQDWFDRNANIIAEKGVTAVNEIPADCMVNGDRFLIASNINNFISNAMSHVEGEKIITASVEDAHGKTRLCIANTGKQIADKDIDKIWTSFYRADKSLSRKQGRFGLGLAIVASIQRLHGEAYGAINTDEGVKFWFDCKKPENNGQTE